MNGSRVIHMNKEDLKPFTWEDYKDSRYQGEFILKSLRGEWVISNHPLFRVETRNGEVYFQAMFSSRRLSLSELKLPKKSKT